MRQTNHNGRVNAKTGKAYSRKHNDRQYDVTKADNIDPSMVPKNIIIHYDRDNNPIYIDSTDENRTSIDTHEHELYQELFGESLSAQHRRNEAARHPERNKSIDDLLDGKNTCPEETIFQIGSVDDGSPPPLFLLQIFEEYQSRVKSLYGDNIHFLDAVLHLDEAVPHLHIRKVWTYEGKDGLDISQNKALEQMGFIRPDPDKEQSKWNNAKITFSEWERNLKLELCEKHQIKVEKDPKTPGKSTMTKEEAIALKLKENNIEIRKELMAAEKKLEAVNADLVSEEEKTKAITDKNIFGMEKKIVMTPDEFRRWQRSAETKEHNEALKQEIKDKERDLEKREYNLDKREWDLKEREDSVDDQLKKLNAYRKKLERKEENLQSEVSARVKSGIEAALPSKIKERQTFIDRKEEELDAREKKLNSVEQHQYEVQVHLQALSKRLDKREKDLAEEVKRSVAETIKDAFRDFFTQFKANFIRLFKGSKQESVISVIREMPIDSAAAGRLFSYGFTSVRGLTVGDVLDRAESEDIREALHEAGAGYRQIRESDVDAVRDGLSKGADIEEIITVVAEQASERIVQHRSR
jgi:DNA repair exonuclease SbcCD ATPase subunit